MAFYIALYALRTLVFYVIIILLRSTL
jgi:hypothetical protein